MDLLVITLVFAFFMACLGFLALCQNLMDSK
jgi:hypothetical protein